MHAAEAISLLVIALGAFLIPLLSGRAGLPSAVGEIAFGVIVGPHVLGLIEPGGFVAILSEFGFALLMFLIGFELDFTRIARNGWRGMGLASASAAGLFVLAAGAAAALEMHPFLALAFGAVSLGIVMATLREARLTDSRAGQITILVGSMGEFLTIVSLTAAGLYYRIGAPTEIARALGKLGLIFSAAYLFLVVLRTLIWWWPESFARLVRRGDPSEIGVRAAMATMLVFVALAALMGVEAILGSFVAGALFAFVIREKEVLRGKLSSIGFGFFVPIFFITVGAGFDLPAAMHLDALPLLGLFLGASVAVKLAAALPLKLLGLGWRETAGAGLILATPLTLLVVISRVGLDLGVLVEREAAALVLLAVVSSALLPLAFRLVMKSAAAAGAGSK